MMLKGKIESSEIENKKKVVTYIFVESVKKKLKQEQVVNIWNHNPRKLFRNRRLTYTWNMFILYLGKLRKMNAETYPSKTIILQRYR